MPAAPRVAHRARASVRSLILTAAFGLVLVLPLASVIAPAREVTIPQSYATRFLIEEEIVERVDEPGVRLTQAPEPSSPRWSMPSTRALVGSVWLAGAIVTLLPLALGLWRLREIRRRARVWAEGAELADALHRRPTAAGRGTMPRATSRRNLGCDETPRHRADCLQSGPHREEHA